MGNTTERDEPRTTGDKYNEMEQTLTRLQDKSEELIRQADEIAHKIRLLGRLREVDRAHN